MATIPLDPEIAPALAEALSLPAFNQENLASFRQDVLAANVPVSEKVEWSDHVVSDTARVRVYQPKGEKRARPCLFAMHGGGYIAGNYELENARFDRLCQEMDLVGVSVEYRLAPECPYPGPLEDCYAGLAWTLEHAAEIGVDPGRVGITGVSAGGGLCAALALLVRERGELEVQYQLLECPMLDDRQTTASSQAEGLLGWRRESNTFGWQSYLGERYGRDDVPGTAAPSRATDLSGLPPALVCVGGADGFRDENIEYALRLGAAGVETELHVYPGVPHGHAVLVGTDLLQRWTRDVDGWLLRHLDRDPRA